MGVRGCGESPAPTRKWRSALVVVRHAVRARAEPGLVAVDDDHGRGREPGAGRHGRAADGRGETGAHERLLVSAGATSAPVAVKYITK